MSLLVVGSIAYDTVMTPFGQSEETLGGSATYFSFAAQFLTDVRLVGVVGEDFSKEYISWFKERRIDITGLESVKGRTFRWTGKYQGDMNTAETLHLELNVFGEFKPKIPVQFQDTPFVFLANGHPELQMQVLSQVKKPRLVFADTMNYWIDTAREPLMKLMREVDGLILNDGEARQLTGQHLTVAAGRDILKMGPKLVVVKKGEHGALLFRNDSIFAIPAYPLAQVLDPTGAGDSFAGGFMGHLARCTRLTDAAFKKALIYGTVLASYNVEAFSLQRLRSIAAEDIERRAADFAHMLRVD